jgi:hypothetical protein
MEFLIERPLLKTKKALERTFFANLQGNFETNTQLGLRNQLIDGMLFKRLPNFFKEIYTQPRGSIENAYWR